MLDGVPDLPGLVSMSVYGSKPINFSQCSATPFNGFRKHDNCMTPKHKWYVTPTFFVWMLMIRQIITLTCLTSMVNFGMCTNSTTGFVSTSGGGLFSFGSMA